MEHKLRKFWNPGLSKLRPYLQKSCWKSLEEVTYKYQALMDFHRKRVFTTEVKNINEQEQGMHGVWSAVGRVEGGLRGPAG